MTSLGLLSWFLRTDGATADSAAHALVQWFSTFGPPETLVTDGGSHFVNSVLAEVTQTLRTEHHVTVAYAPWANGTVERVNKEVVAVLRSLNSQWNLRKQDWPYLIPVVKYA